MAYTFQQHDTSYQYHLANRKASVLTRFFKWAEEQGERNHLAWVGGAVTATSAVLFPLTMTVILLNGAVFGLIIAAMAALALVVITNLAALPTKYTIPFFFLGVIIDAAIIVSSFFIKY
jgi:hypothetical protein